MSAATGWYHMHVKTGRGRPMLQIAFRYGGSRTVTKFIEAQNRLVLSDRIPVSDTAPQIVAAFEAATGPRT